MADLIAPTLADFNAAARHLRKKLDSDDELLTGEPSEDELVAAGPTRWSQQLDPEAHTSIAISIKGSVNPRRLLQDSLKEGITRKSHQELSPGLPRTLPEDVISQQSEAVPVSL